MVESGAPREGFSESGLRRKLSRYARLAGREVVEKVLLLYYAAQRPDLPAWAKTAIYGALAYFILPLDAIPDLTPLLGFNDDLGALAAALLTVAQYIDDEVREKAEKRLSHWFGPREEKD